MTAKKSCFLAAYARLGTIQHAALDVGITRQCHYKWLTRDPDYAVAFARAETEATEALEREARRRAIEGVEEPVHWRGKRVDAIRKYSDTLLIFLLKGALPSKYRDRIEHSGPGGGPLSVEWSLKSLTTVELEHLRELAEKATT